MFLTCSWVVHDLLVTCSWYCSQLVTDLLLTWSCFAHYQVVSASHHLFNTCPWLFYNFGMTYSTLVQVQDFFISSYWLMTSSQLVHELFLFLWLIHDLFTTSAQFFMTCSQLDHNFFITCYPLVTSFSWLVHYFFMNCIRFQVLKKKMKVHQEILNKRYSSEKVKVFWSLRYTSLITGNK